jgi:predicted small secreted protein
MDKKGDKMTKKTVLLLGLIVFTVSLIGCNTVKGAAAGAKQDWEDAKKADDQMEKTLW